MRRRGDLAGGRPGSRGARVSALSAASMPHVTDRLPRTAQVLLVRGGRIGWRVAVVTLRRWPRQAALTLTLGLGLVACSQPAPAPATPTPPPPTRPPTVAP